MNNNPNASQNQNGNLQAVNNEQVVQSQPNNQSQVVQPQQAVQSQPLNANLNTMNNVVNQAPTQSSTGINQQNIQSNNQVGVSQNQSVVNNQQLNVSNRKLDTSKIVGLIKKNKLIVIGILVLIVVVAIFTRGGKAGGVMKKTTTNNSNVTTNEKTEEQKRMEEEALKGTFVIGLYRLKFPEGYSLKDTIDGTIILTDEDEHRIELTLEKYQTAYKKSNAIQAEIADVYSLDGYETKNCGMRKIEQTPWAVYDGYRDGIYKTIAFVEFQSKMLKIQLENDSLEYNTKILEEFNELIKHTIKK